MKKIGLLLTFIIITFLSFAQTNISGIINRYAAVTAIDSCTNSLIVQNAAGFEVDMSILLIQTKGAIINNSNTNNFGNITDLRSTGLYERATIQAINGNQITLKNTILNRYNLDGGVQIVSLAMYENATVTDTLRAQPWDGQTGGILALEVTNTLTVNAAIQADGAGFRGGIAGIAASNNCTALTSANAYSYDLNNWRGASKGEGVADFTIGREAGRGAQANGGGGGNDHNAGGGGGANVAPGGNGGKNEEPDILGCDGAFPGLGGKTISFTDNRIFLGGGGGAGHENNDVATDGGNGGGIIILIAKNVVGNNFKIAANGIMPDTTSGDGSGGGGGGGTIVLEVDSIISPFLVEVQGGNGGVVNNLNQERCAGPGGGGGGGRFLMNPMLQTDYNLGRGEAGRSINSMSCGNSSNSAQTGTDGTLEPFTGIPQSTEMNLPPAIAAQPSSISACENKSTTIEVMITGSRLQYQWLVDKSDGTGFQNVVESGTYSGTQTPTLFIGSVLSEMGNYKFQLRVSSVCNTTISSQPISITLQTAPTAQFTFAFTTAPNSIDFNNISTNADKYFWNFGDSTNSNLQNPRHTYAQNGDYTVTLAAINDCDSITFSQNISLAAEPIAGFSATPTQGCQPLSVTFQNTSSADATSFTWILPGATPSFSNQKNPTVTYITAGTYSVTLVASNASGIDTLTQDSFVVINKPPTANFNTATTANPLIIKLVNNSIGGTTYLWDFGDTQTSTEANPTHTYQMSGTYIILLTATNACGSQTKALQITVGEAPTARFTAVRPNGCAPHTVNFSDASSGEYTSRFWEFPGGNPATSTDASPRVVYAMPGEYDVRLTVRGTLGSDTVLNIAYVNVLPSPTPIFTFAVNGNTITFNNESAGSTSYQWSFGDGQTSTQLNPVHIFANSGVYTVTLNASNAYCGRSLSRVIAVGLNATEDLRESGILVFPNPTHNLLTINAETFGKPLQMKLFSLDGKLIFNQNFTKQLEVELSAFANGMYLLQLQSEEKVWVAKIVKQ